jgi:hypothetical protein
MPEFVRIALIPKQRLSDRNNKVSRLGTKAKTDYFVEPAIERGQATLRASGSTDSGARWAVNSIPFDQLVASALSHLKTGVGGVGHVV